MYKYTQILPSKKLSPYIECFWIMGKGDSGRSITDVIVPNACSEIVVIEGNGYERLDLKHKTTRLVKGINLIGQRSNYFKLAEIQDGTTDIGFRFKPYGLKSFIDEVRLFTNEIVPINTVFDDWSIQLEIDIQNERNVLNKVKILQNFLECQVKTAPKVNQKIEKGVSIVHCTKGNIKVQELQRKLGVSKSTLKRLFYCNIGISPKEFVDIWRLNYLINSRRESHNNHLTELALDYGFFDQSHFNKTFKKFTGNSPRRYFSSRFNLTSVTSEEVEKRNNIYR